MFHSTPAPAKSFNINTNSRDLDYQVSTQQQAIDPLCLRDEVRFTVSSSGRRVKYFPTKVSKRWLVRELYNQMINA